MIKIGKNISEFSVHSCQPKTKDELKYIIRDRIKEQGTECDLNNIDVSLIDDMSYLFYRMNFKGDISNWNVSNVKNMSRMFIDSTFNGDISKWDVSNVRDMRGMFFNSSFTGDISNWDVRNVTDMCAMFYDSSFDKDISNWKINIKCNTLYMFDLCLIEEEYKPKSLQSCSR